MLLHTLRLFCIAGSLHAISIPPGTGPYHVGYTQHVFNHTTYDDPTPAAVNGTGTFIVATIYYPTLQLPNTTSPYLDPINIDLFSASFDYPPDSLSHLTTTLQFQAPTLFNTSTSPTLIFSPGGGVPCVAYTAILSDLASHGYAVVAIDHPGEVPYLPTPYTDSGTYGWGYTYSFTAADIVEIYAYRVADIYALVSFLPSLAALYAAPFNLTHFGVFGHSVGGAAAAAILAAQESNASTTTPPLFRAGLNLDGGYDFPANSTYPSLGLRHGGPFVQLGGDEHGFNGTADPTWAPFGAAQTGWWRWLVVHGAQHLDFSDIPLWIDLLDLRNKTTTPQLGGIGGLRVMEITRVFVRALFGLVRGETEVVFEGRGPFPEVEFVEGGDGD
ncbi:Uu.00g010470.m01.CDS01 [Anthostomella pinea]|uniref:1-alkyl-2-acetylglycerophosphocholine esterase n=1 Tax=Anthostomella pinea TaxID=933095 RepID=A0AAI8VYT8_9PEZI|nr:Uu.00g010470.m01.CDS01 [Anthostomella pinea]